MRCISCFKLLSIHCFKLADLQLAINDHYYANVTYYFLFLLSCTSSCHQRSFLTTYFSVFLVSSVLRFNLQLAITTKRILLSISCFKFVALLTIIYHLLLIIPCFTFVALPLAINDHSWPDVTQYSLFRVCFSSSYHQRSLPSRCYLVFHFSSLFHCNLPSRITANQQLLSIHCFMFVSLQLANNDHC
jgi:hypothetical protein